MLYDRVWVNTPATGTAETISLGSARDGFRSMADAGVTDGDTVSYVIEDGTSWEYGRGTWNSSGNELVRNPDASSVGGGRINLSGTANVLITPLARDFTERLRKDENLADLDSAATSRGNLGLGDAATKDTGTAAGEVAAGDHTHASSDLSDVNVSNLDERHELVWDGSQWVNELGPNFIEVRNDSGATISEGTLVLITGNTGVNPIITVADKDTDEGVSGITIEDIANGADGIIQANGEIQESFIDTSGMTAGDLLYLGSSGGFVDTPPATGHVIRIGKVGVVNASNGSILLDCPGYKRPTSGDISNASNVSGADVTAALDEFEKRVVSHHTLPNEGDGPSSYDSGLSFSSTSGESDSSFSDVWSGSGLGGILFSILRSSARFAQITVGRDFMWFRQWDSGTSSWHTPRRVQTDNDIGTESDHTSGTAGKLATTEHVRGMTVGTVSQSGGEPTGAIIERGSNSNGEYIRYADGTQICWNISLDGDTSGTTWTYPVSFNSNPMVQVTPNSSNPRGATSNRTSSEAIVYAWQFDESGSAVNTFVQAMGRWF